MLNDKNENLKPQLVEKRFLIEMLDSLVKEMEIEMRPFSDDWIISLVKDGKTRRIFGYNFDLNNATAAMIAKDKVANSLMLEDRGLPTVEHILIPNPNILKNYHADEKGNWEKIIEYAKGHNYNVVCKPLNGTMGSDIFFINNQTDLEIAIHKLISKYRDAAISPYYEIEDEFRVIILDGEILVIIRKKRPDITGDGRSTLLQSVLKEHGSEQVAKLSKELSPEDLDRVLDDGEKYIISQKHNLTHGAIPEVLDAHDDKYEELSGLAIGAAEAINIKFAAIDIITVEGQYLVLEVNSGVTMKKFASFSDENYNLAKSVYRKALEKMFK